jgi:uroporphyrinogen decarboxylase
MLGPAQFSEFSSEYVKSITGACAFTDASTVYHICGNSMHLIEKMCRSGVDAISMDSPETGVDLRAAAKRAAPNIAVIGNINPTGKILSGCPSEVEEDVRYLLKEMESYPNFILSTGCDLPQETPADNITAFMNTGRNYRLN